MAPRAWKCPTCGWTRTGRGQACSCPQRGDKARAASRPRERSVRSTRAAAPSGWIDYSSQGNQKEVYGAHGWSSPCSYAEAVARTPRKAATPEQATRARAHVPAQAEEHHIATPQDAEASDEEERRKQFICTIESSTACAASLKTLPRDAERDKQIRIYEEDIESAKHALTRMQPASAQRLTMERTRVRREAACEKCSQEVARLDEEIEERHVRREAVMVAWEAAKSKLQLIDDSIAAILPDEEDDNITEPVCNGTSAAELVASIYSGNAPPELLVALARAYAAAFPQEEGRAREEEDADMREPVLAAAAPKRRADQLMTQQLIDLMDSDYETEVMPQVGGLSPSTPSDEQVLTALAQVKKARVKTPDQVSVFHEALPRAEEG
jgi:hypothetical protein